MTKNKNWGKNIADRFFGWFLILLGVLNFAFYPNYALQARVSHDYKARVIIGSIFIILGIGVLLDRYRRKNAK